MDNTEFEDYVKMAMREKSGRHLHSLAEKQLALYLSYLYPRDCTVSEVGAVLGGRNDLIQFSFNGRRAVYEFFFSPNQVPQDLRLLEQCEAVIKVAILLDREVKPKLALEYFRKKPNHFPFLWLSDLLMPSRKEICLKQLRELIRLVNENIPFNFSLFVDMPKRPLLSGETVVGDYEVLGLPITHAVSKIINKVQRKSNGSVPISITVDTNDNSASGDVAGKFTVQY